MQQHHVWMKSHENKSHCPSHIIVNISDIPVTETKTDTEMINISKTHTETNTEKIFNTDTIYI